ncbi:unnamed protein product [marine sediment metagenome]|uniref:Uncharacterized protein n=1 Tax=marine sediment metagenome TaxID=412755 RepID=X1MSB9_9ZZZZ
MKAEVNQIPGHQGRKDTSNNVPHSKGTDALWSYIRRLTAQVKSLELAATTARRDINRIDRKQYREEEKSPPSLIPGTEQDLPHFTPLDFNPMGLG